MDRISLRRDVPSNQLLRDWYSILRPSEHDFVRGKLRALIHLIRFEIDWTLLQDLVTRWNPDTYTFHFGTLELAPLYEEYGYLSEVPHRSGLLPLPRIDRPKEYIVKLLRITPAILGTLFTPQGHIVVDALLQFQASPYLPNLADGQTSARAFILMFAGTILYPFTAKSIHLRAIYLTKAIIEGHPFLPNLIGETNFCLTDMIQKARRGVRNHSVTFSPALLQAWFFTHLGVTGECLRRDNYPGLLNKIVDRAYLPMLTSSRVRAFCRSL